MRHLTSELMALREVRGKRRIRRGGEVKEEEREDVKWRGICPRVVNIATVIGVDGDESAAGDVDPGSK